MAQAADPFRAIEQRVRGRLGVFAMTGGGRTLLSWREDERFAMASTFKVALAGAVLARVDRGEEQLDRLLTYGQEDMLATSPVTTSELPRGAITIERLCAAVLEVSDNTGANLLLRTLGGPEGFTQALRAMGDSVTRLDRYELELNTATKDDLRDTTSPRAMAMTLRALTLGEMLLAPSRARLLQSMVRARTGLTMIRAGLPKDWRCGDKTGRGGNGATNNLAVIWPPYREGVVVAAYLSECTAPLAQREGAIAEVGRILARRLET